jgi:hypothetical protein
LVGERLVIAIIPLYKRVVIGLGIGIHIDLTPRLLGLGDIKNQLTTTFNNHQTIFSPRTSNPTTPPPTPPPQTKTKTKPHYALRRLGATLPRQIPRRFIKIFQPSVHTTKLIAQTE